MGKQQSYKTQFVPDVAAAEEAVELVQRPRRTVETFAVEIETSQVIQHFIP